MQETKQSLQNLWWCFYPIRGVRLTDAQLTLDGPILPDVTLIGWQDIDRLINAKNFEGSEKLRLALTQSGFSKQNQFYVAVRCRSNPHINPAAAAWAEKQADEFMAILMLYLYSETSIATCGLAHRASDRSTGWLAIAENDKDYNFNLKLQGPVTFVEDSSGIVCDLKDLLPAVQQSQIGEIANVLLNQPLGHYHKNTLEQFRIAVRTLAHSIYTNQPGELVIGIVTMLEILLSENNETYEVIKKRVGFLLNQDIEFIEKHVFRPRNNWVHRSDPVTIEISRESLRCAISTLSSFANILKGSPKQTSRTDLLTWLDLQTVVQFNSRPDKIKALWKHFDKVNLIAQPPEELATAPQT